MKQVSCSALSKPTKHDTNQNSSITYESEPLDLDNESFFDQSF